MSWPLRSIIVTDDSIFIAKGWDLRHTVSNVPDNQTAPSSFVPEKYEWSAPFNLIIEILESRSTLLIRTHQNGDCRVAFAAVRNKIAIVDTLRDRGVSTQRVKSTLHRTISMRTSR